MKKKGPISTRLRVTKGPHKGVAFKLVSAKITIGRGSDNNIALDQDEKCSRKQAIISLNPDGRYFIKDLSGRSSMKINDRIKIQSDLENGDLIKFGSTVMRFEMKESATGMMVSPIAPQAPPPIATTPAVPVVSPVTTPVNKANQPLQLKQDIGDFGPGIQGQGQGFPQYDTAPPQKNKKTPKKNKALFNCIIGALILMGVYLGTAETENEKQNEDKLRTLLDQEENVHTLEELKTKELEKRSKNSDISFQNAQSAYISGIRDYRKGVYSRAIESFRVCKTLYPKHELCGSYLQNAKIKHQQLIQSWMVAGKNYRDKRRFVPCMSAFKNVFLAIKDEENITYKEAYKNFEICKIQFEDRY